jgi:hypothetical protein
MAQETTIGAQLSTSAAVAARLFRFLDAIPNFDFYLQALAVDQQSRAVGNAGARKFYERRAFTLQATAPLRSPFRGLTTPNRTSRTLGTRGPALVATTGERKVVARFTDRRRHQPEGHEAGKDPAANAEGKDRLQDGCDTDRRHQ